MSARRICAKCDLCFCVRCPQTTATAPASTSAPAVPPLLAAVRAGNLEQVKKLLASPGVNVNEKTGDEGISPLIAAAYRGHLAIAQALVNAGAKVNILNSV